jgi:hypothetical protein
MHTRATCHPDNPGWANLSPELHTELVTAVRASESITGVLRGYGIGRQSFYRWLRIGHGTMTHWNDGCIVSQADHVRCYRLAIAIAEARVARETVALDRLRAIAQ